MQNGSSLHQDDRKMKMDFNLKPNTHLSSRWKFLFYSNTIKYKLPTDWWLKGDKWQTDVCGNTFRPIPDYWQSIPLHCAQYVPIFWQYKTRNPSSQKLFLVDRWHHLLVALARQRPIQCYCSLWFRYYTQPIVLIVLSSWMRWNCQGAINEPQDNNENYGRLKVMKCCEIDLNFFPR